MFDFVTESFDLEKTNEYILSIQISLDGFSFSVFSSRENKIICFKLTPLKISSENLILPHFSEWINNEEIIRKKYKQIILLYFTIEFSLIPENLYSSQLVKEATNHLIAENEHKQVEITTLEESGIPAKLVFYIPEKLKLILNQNFPSATLIHPVQLLVKENQKGNKRNRSVLLYHKKSFILVVSREENILFANGFNIEHINDLVYFVLNVLMQLNLNLKETDFYISDALTKTPELLDILRPYIPEISYLPPSNSFENAEMVSNSIHRYFSFF